MAKKATRKKASKKKAAKKKAGAKRARPSKSPRQHFNEAGLTDQQELFAREFLVDLNATQAAIRAGYSAKTANQQGARLLANVKVAARIRELMAERSERTEINADQVLEQLMRLGFSDIRELFADGALRDIAELSDGIAAAVSSVEVVTRPTGEKDEDGRPIVDHVHKIRMTDKVRPLELLGKHLAMFVERREHSGPGGGEIPIGGGLASLLTDDGED